MTVGNSSIIHPSQYSQYSGQQNPLVDNNFSTSVYNVHPQQNLSLLKNYFSANSGTLSSSASIHGIANNFGSRSTTHLSHNNPSVVAAVGVLGSKGLPSPTPRVHDPSTNHSQIHQYHFSQPELRHNSGNDVHGFNSQPDESHVKISNF